MTSRVDLSRFFSEMSLSEKEKREFVEDVLASLDEEGYEDGTSGSECEANSKLILCLCSFLGILGKRLSESTAQDATKIPYFLGHILSRMINYEEDDRIGIWSGISEDVSSLMTHVNFMVGATVASSMIGKHCADLHTNSNVEKEKSSACDCVACRAGREAASCLPPTTFTILGGTKPDA